MIVGWGISCEFPLSWKLMNLTPNQSVLVQVMAWCPQATSHYLSQCWPSSMSTYGVTRPQWVDIQRNKIRAIHIFSANIALNRPVNISSLWIGNKADGNDGDLNTCAVTFSEPYPWWAVDLGARYALHKVTVYAFFSGGKDSLIYLYEYRWTQSPEKLC